MFLALKEIKFSKLKYALIIGIITLIAYAVFILSGLANGLAVEFKQAIVDWNGEQIVLSDDSNKNLSASQLTEKNLDDVSATKKAPLSIYNGAIKNKNDKINITLFGTSSNAFILPEFLEGHQPNEEHEISISKNLADLGYKINDTIKMGKDNIPMKVVGISPTTFYAVTPVIYSSIEDANKIKFGKNFTPQDNEQPMNAIVTQDKATKINSNATPDLAKLTIDNFIESLPGYAEQNLTLNAMIYFLFVIVTAIIGIFMYVLTLQKASIFGVMKAQGISNGFIINALIKQSLLVGLFGISLGFAIAYITSLILPSTMPFEVPFQLWSVYSLVLLLVTVLGSIFSIRTITNVDPMKAIGG